MVATLPLAENLPIYPFLENIHHQLRSGDNLVLQAEPGAGKSTQVPLSLLGVEWLNGKKIIMLEPRRIAAKSIAYYLASLLKEDVGRRVGYHVKNEKNMSADTQLLIVTEGVLTGYLQQDPELQDIGLIIFDEFHERSIQADLGLMLALEVQQALRDDLKLLIMSATIDTQMLADYLGGAGVIQCPGRSFPVSVTYQGQSFHRLSDRVLHGLKLALSDEIDKGAGDVLVFLPGSADIRRCLESAQEHWQHVTQWRFLPLYGGLNISQQEQAIQRDPDGRRRIIFATNIAETSLTIEGITLVIDAGLEKRIQYDPQSGMTRLVTSFISKASAEQRKGRAGRVQPGHCIRLWSEAKQATLEAYQDEEILTAELSSLVLDLFAWGLTDYQKTSWLTPPPSAHYSIACELLRSLGLISEQGLTALGKEVSAIPVHPRLATMLVKAKHSGDAKQACDIAALLTEQDILKSSSNGVDFLQRVLALQEYRDNKKQAIKHFLVHRSSMEAVLKTSSSLFKKVTSISANTVEADWQRAIAALLLEAYPERLAKQRGRSNRYLMANGKGVYIADDDSLVGSEWLIVCDCDAQKREGRIYIACKVEQEQALAFLEHRCEREDTFQLDAKKGNIQGRRRVSYGAIHVGETVIKDIPSSAFQTCLVDALHSEGLSLLQWTTACENWLMRAEWLGSQLDDFPCISEDWLLQRLQHWLLPYISDVNSLGQLKKVPLYDLLIANLSWEQQQLLDAEACSMYVSPSGKRVPVIYDPHQGPTVSIILQEMFGELESPMLAKGQVALRFELLSPARRPIQTTSDLANFWGSSYFEVAKDMRGRYPRHRWPDEPLLEKPGHSRKPKKPLK